MTISTLKPDTFTHTHTHTHCVLDNWIITDSEFGDASLLRLVERLGEDTLLLWYVNAVHGTRRDVGDVGSALYALLYFCAVPCCAVLCVSSSFAVAGTIE
jgi:hypothetical protein